MQSDIQKLIKAVVSQRKYIETLEADLDEQSKIVVALQNEQSQHEELKKQVNAHKHEKIDFLNKED